MVAGIERDWVPPSAVQTRANAAAADVLARYWASADGVVVLPVDATILAERVGADVFLDDLAGDLEGFIYKAPRERAEIVLDRSLSPVRKRFTCAHELGHLVERLTDDDLEIAFTDKKDELSSQGRDPHEIFANTFAAATLMPAPLVRKHAREGMDLEDLALKFWVSKQAMQYRLSTLGLA
jgi:Zn-dependent peptidase ImmA (M78 family)